MEKTDTQKRRGVFREKTCRKRKVMQASIEQ